MFNRKKRAVQLTLVDAEPSAPPELYPGNPYPHLNAIAENVIGDIAAAIILVKASNTLFSAIEHIVVTKIK